MYLSRLELDLNKRETMRALASPARFHGAVESAFPSERAKGQSAIPAADNQLSLFADTASERAARPPVSEAQFSLFGNGTPEAERSRKLWRLDTLHGKTYLLLLSESRPDLRSADTQFGTGHGGETRDYTTLLGSIHTGDVLRFRLTANPTVSKAQPRGADGKKPRGEVKAFLVKREDHKGWFRNLKTWLVRKSEQNGFRLAEDDFDVVESRWRQFRKGDNRKQSVRFLSVTYEGILVVTDEGAFRSALISGIGREKAYGMGLLTVMRTGGAHG